jgi:hypothetical protein
VAVKAAAVEALVALVQHADAFTVFCEVLSVRLSSWSWPLLIVLLTSLVDAVEVATAGPGSRAVHGD